LRKEASWLSLCPFLSFPFLSERGWLLSSDAAWLARVLIPEGDGLATDDDADFPCSEGKIFLVGKKAQGHEQSDLYVFSIRHVKVES
jgi:hypothetical protein